MKIMRNAGGGYDRHVAALGKSLAFRNVYIFRHEVALGISSKKMPVMPNK